MIQDENEQPEQQQPAETSNEGLPEDLRDEDLDAITGGLGGQVTIAPPKPITIVGGITIPRPPHSGGH